MFITITTFGWVVKHVLASFVSHLINRSFLFSFIYLIGSVKYWLKHGCGLACLRNIHFIHSQQYIPHFNYLSFPHWITLFFETSQHQIRWFCFPLLKSIIHGATRDRIAPQHLHIQWSLFIKQSDSSLEDIIWAFVFTGILKQWMLWKPFLQEIATLLFISFFVEEVKYIIITILWQI